MTYDKSSIKAFLQDTAKNPSGTTDGKKNTYLVYRMLQALYQRQTVDEQATEQTKYVNGMGFTGVDAPILSSIAQSSQRYNDLTEKQVSKIVARKLQKYAGQLALVAATKQAEHSAIAKAKLEEQEQAYQLQQAAQQELCLTS